MTITILKKNCALFLFLISFGFFAAEAVSGLSIPDQAKKLIEEGNRIVLDGHDNWWNNAAEKYWQAVIAGGGEDAIKKLTVCYNSWTRREKFDWDIVRKYVQTAADKEFERRGHKAVKFTGEFFLIVESEPRIINDLAVETIAGKYPINGDMRIEFALRKLFRKYYLVSPKDGKRYYFPAKDNKAGSVLVFDNETAKIFFNFEKTNSAWSVYVRSPYGSEITLFPFERFHIYAYQQKMDAFIELCRMLGAKKITATYQWEKSDKIKGAAKVSGKTFEGAAAGVKAERRKSEKCNLYFEQTFEGSKVIPRKVVSEWFKIEKSWKSLADARTGTFSNRQVKAEASFDYTYDYGVNVDAQVEFQKALVEIGSGVKLDFSGFEKVSWNMTVDFAPARFRTLWTKTLEIH